MRITLTHDFVGIHAYTTGNNEPYELDGEQVIVSYSYGMMKLMAINDSDWITVEALGHQLSDAFVISLIEYVYPYFSEDNHTVIFHHPAEMLSLEEPLEELVELDLID